MQRRGKQSLMSLALGVGGLPTLRCLACALLPTNDTDSWKMDDSAYLLESEMLSLNRCG